MEEKKYGSKGGHDSNPLEGCEQLSKISSGNGEGPIQSPLDKGHIDKGGSSD